MPGHILELGKVKKMETNCVARVVAAYILDYIKHTTLYIHFSHKFSSKNDKSYSLTSQNWLYLDILSQKKNSTKKKVYFFYIFKFK